jgi:D-beta-D-heptose 7-phosphate kinase / D-beta-D-heptose 1-phosphate adenosyltransferase
VKPNYGQAMRAIGEPVSSDGEARAHRVLGLGGRVLEATGAQVAAVTMDGDGAVVFERERPPYRTYARPLGQSRAAGAGDTFAAALTLALAAGADTPVAAEMASGAAAVVLGKDGTATCSAAELTELWSAHGKRIDGGRAASRMEFYRAQGKRIVFTNGCFDILHRGHITFLDRAKALGDVLVVGINSDGSVERLKGPGRPVNPLEDRIEVLAALSCIDHIVPFDGDTPSDVIRLVRPDVFVKGGDYTIDMLPEAAVVREVGGTVDILPYVEDRSTTGIIDRIRQRASTEAGVGAPGR